MYILLQKYFRLFPTILNSTSRAMNVAEQMKKSKGTCNHEFEGTSITQLPTSVALSHCHHFKLHFCYLSLICRLALLPASTLLEKSLTIKGDPIRISYF